MIALTIIGSLLVIEIIGLIVTYSVCYLYHGGPPEDRPGIYEGWFGGDVPIMLFLWPFTLVFFIGRIAVNRLNKELADKVEKDKHEPQIVKRKESKSLRSGQEIGIYNSDIADYESAAGKGTTGRGLVRTRRK